jgi:6-phosphofructokinase 1
MTKPGLAFLSSGNNLPGINAIIRAVVRRASIKFTPYGVERGFEGLAEGLIRKLGSHDVSGKMGKPGCFLDSSDVNPDQNTANISKIIENLHKKNIQSIIFAGGIEDLQESQKLVDAGFQVIGVPSTIQDDIPGTDICLGVDTAVNTIVKNIALIRSSRSDTNRNFLVRVAGKTSGHLAIRAAITSGAELVLASHNSCTDLDWILKRMTEGEHNIFITLLTSSWKPGRAQLKKYLESKLGNMDLQVRETTLGWVQRGGSPSGFDRLLGTKFGDSAVSAIEEGLNATMIAIVNNKIMRIPYIEVIGKSKPVNQEHLSLLSLNE